MKRLLLSAVLLAIFTLAVPSSVLAGDSTSLSGQVAEAYQLIDMVNALRASYGLYPYQVNASLMAAAQSHSNWAASAGYHSHVQPDGSRPRDRAAWAGYGGGATFFIHENIYWGGYASPQSAMDWWINSPIHFQGMTSSRYVEIGAGVAYSDSGGYLTLLFAVISGQEPAASASGGASAGGGVAAVAPVPIAVGPGLVQPEDIAVATPGPDGAIIHSVQPNEALINIATAYEIDLYYLLSVNGIGDDALIYPDEQLIVRLPNTPTPTPTLTPTTTPTPAPTFRATPTPWDFLRTPDSSPVSVAELPSEGVSSPSVDGKPEPTELELLLGRRINKGLMTGIFIVIGIAGLGLVGWGMFSARRQKPYGD